MPEVIVELRNPTEQGRLYYERDPEIEGHIVYIQTPMRRRIIHSVIINGGQAILEFDADRILLDVEFISNWNAWRKLPVLEVPRVSRIADLALSNLEPDPERPPSTKIDRDGFLRHYCSFDTVAMKTTDANRSCVQFLFGTTEPVGEWIALSHQCFALVADNFLRGFFVQLANAPLRQYKTRQTQRAAG